MNKLKKALRGFKHLCFLDFEGTQFTHEMIAFGAVFATLKSDLSIKKYKNPIKRYVKCRSNIGKFVEDLTGINKVILDKEGIPFSQALQEIKKYCGLSFKKTLFVTFGNHDIRIISQSLSHSMDADAEIAKTIMKNYLDLQAFISEFVKDEHNNPYSLEKYVEFFGLTFDGAAHDPMYDAFNLMNIYDAFLKQKDKVAVSYMNALSKDTKIPVPVREILKKLANGESVDAKDYRSEVDKYLE
ncbi:MAG: exonuclease domain-containing protein [Bacilli bacterium]|nr:exonuclease domain-containing protein [Bacilli bacterium]